MPSLCSVISGVELRKEKAEETEIKLRKLFSRELSVNKDDFDYELNKAHRLPTELTRRNFHPNITCKFRTHGFREQLYSQKKKNHRSTNRKINFHISLRKYPSNLLKKTNNYMKMMNALNSAFQIPMATSKFNLHTTTIPFLILFNHS